MLRIYYTEDDTITQSGNKTAQKNSDGHALLVRVVICNEWKWFFRDPVVFEMAANYTRFFTFT